MTFDHTRRACYTGYITQAIVNNLAPLLFIVFQSHYGISLEQLGRLALLNFSVQIVTDIIAVKYVDRTGYRVPMILAHVLSVAGLVLLGLAPFLFANLYTGLCVAIVIYAIGGGLLEVLVSPVAEALPGPEEKKAARMSLLHSFYCWGQVLVVIGTTLLLGVTGHGDWFYLPVLWAIVPLVNLFLFLRVPLPDIVPDHERTRLRDLLKIPVFPLILVLMLCAGASELTMSQWSSFFAEKGLGVSKVWGDLAGPCLFAVLMGGSRAAYGLLGDRIPLVPAMLGSAILCLCCYVIAACSGSPLWSLAGCAVCGMSVGLMWPGTYSLAAARFPLGGAAMFGVLAIAGDMGCAIGPWMAGEVASQTREIGSVFHSLAAVLPADDASGLRAGILSGMLFPLVIILSIAAYRVLGGRAKPPIPSEAS